MKHQGYKELDIRLSTQFAEKYTTLTQQIPTQQELSEFADFEYIFNTSKRRIAIGGIRYVLKAEQSWPSSQQNRRSVSHYDGSTHPYSYCSKMNEIIAIHGDDDIVYSIRLAAHLLLAWYVNDISTKENVSFSEIGKHCFTIVNVDAKRQRCTEMQDVPTEEHKIARTCANSEDLRVFVRKMSQPNNKKDEFARIKMFLNSTDLGKALLINAGIIHGKYQLDHYLPHSMGGPSVIENAYIMPADGVNQHFNSSFNHHKRRYCGETQHEAFTSLHSLG